MSEPDDGDNVGYGRPPKKSRWKTGQTGNPGRKKARRLRSLKELVDEFLGSSIWVTENGRRRRCTRFEAIFLQLQVKALAGNKRAMNTLLEYVEFSGEGDGGGRVEFQPTPEYARVLAARGDPRGSQ